MMTSHTPGPRVRDSGCGFGCDVRAQSGRKVAATWGINNGYPHRPAHRAECEANARRIVSCVNALEGLLQETLDGGWSGKGISAYAKRLEETNAEFLAALECLYEVATIDNDKDYAAVTNAAAVIAKGRSGWHWQGTGRSPEGNSEEDRRRTQTHARNPDALAEEARKQRNQQGVEWFRLRADENRDLDADELRTTIADVQARAVDESWEEFEPEAHRVKARALEALQQALAAREKHDADQAELARLRAETAAREQKDREECIAREAEENARRDAEAAAQAEREAVIRREQEAKAAADRRELELKLQAEQAEKEAAQAKADQFAAEQRAEQERLAAIEREKKAAEDARQAEIKRQADAKAAEEAEAARHEADKAHKGKVNRAALNALVAGGMPEDCTKQAVTLIAKGLIPNIRITY